MSISGGVTALSGTCPLLALTVNGKLVRTTATTDFSAVACLLLKVGDVVEVQGEAQADGSISARVISRPVSTISGSVSSMSGTCPLLTFTVNGKVVRTTATTEYSGTLCLTLKAGDVVEVQGRAQADGSITATLVRR